MRYALACIGLALAATAGAQAMEQKLAGDIVSLQGSRAEMRSVDGKTIALAIPDDIRISGRSPATLDKLTPGAFVGTTAVLQPDGTLVASEVHIFPESMRGRGEGHGPMANQPGSTMTNATIARVGSHEASTMTNATVAQVAGQSGGRIMTLTYKGGEKTVFVPEKTPVMMQETADRKDLVPGAHVVVYASTQPDGTLAARRITVGLKGLVPPL